MMLGAIAVFLALPFPLVQAQSADPQSTWTGGGFGEVIGGEDRFLSVTVDPNMILMVMVSKMGRKVMNILPGTYGQDAYMNPNLCTLITKGGKISLKI